MRKGAAAYEPLLADGTWPQEPQWEQLLEGQQMRDEGVDVDENAYYSAWVAPSTASSSRKYLSPRAGTA